MIRRTLTNLLRTRKFLSNKFFSLNSVQSQQQRDHSPGSWEKMFLVWTGKYKSIDQIPSHVTYGEMERCHNRMRISIANIMIVLTIIGCVVMIRSGKAAAKRGESLTKMNLDWHKEINAAAEKESSAKI